MADANTKQTLIEFLVASQLEMIEKREQTLESLAHSMEHFESAAKLRSEIATFKSRADRLTQMIATSRPYEADADQKAAASFHEGMPTSVWTSVPFFAVRRLSKRLNIKSVELGKPLATVLAE